MRTWLVFAETVTFYFAGMHEVMYICGVWQDNVCNSLQIKAYNGLLSAMVKADYYSNI